MTATVCSQSGKLPIPGLCDGTIRSEYFAEGTVPTDSCNVHYQGYVCPYSNLPANDPCPFKVQGVLSLTPPEDASLQQGSGTVPAEPITQEVTNPDGTVSTITIPQANTNTCIHTFEYMAQPGIEGIIEQQRNEMTAAQQAAIQAAQEPLPLPPLRSRIPVRLLLRKRRLSSLPADRVKHWIKKGQIRFHIRTCPFSYASFYTLISFFWLHLPDR